MDGVVGHVGEQRLIDVKNPDVSAIAGDLHGLGEGERVVRDELGVRPVGIASHVILDELLATVGNGGPDSGVIGLDGESPAFAEEGVVPGAAAVGGDSDEGIGESARKEGEKEGEEKDASGIHGGVDAEKAPSVLKELSGGVSGLDCEANKTERR